MDKLRRMLSEMLARENISMDMVDRINSFLIYRKHHLPEDFALIAMDNLILMARGVDLVPEQRKRKSSSDLQQVSNSCLNFADAVAD